MRDQSAAIRCNNLPALAWKIDRLLDGPTRLALMRDPVRQLARPHAAREVVGGGSCGRGPELIPTVSGAPDDLAMRGGPPAHRSAPGRSFTAR